MSMVFPGMDPYLEDPAIWPGIHNPLIVYIRDQLRPKIRPRYIAKVDVRVFVQGPAEREISPDIWIKRSRRGRDAGTAAVLDAATPVEVRVPALEIQENYIEIIDRKSKQRIVTAIEVISPTNKYAGSGRDAYVAKQQDVHNSRTHLVEIDLLRRGPHVLLVPEHIASAQGDYDYLISINRARGTRENYQLHLCSLRQRLPKINIPLAEGDADVVLDLQAALEQAYEAGSYFDELPYDKPCIPPLSKADQAWANQLIRKAGLGKSR